MRKKKKLFFILVVLFIVTIVIFQGLKFIIRRIEPTSALEIPNTRVYEDNWMLGFVGATQYYMTINPPKNSEELKGLML